MNYMDSFDKEIYDEGYQSSKDGDLITHCPYREDERILKYFWLGGYHDYEIERGL